MKCPISAQLLRRADAPALSTLTYRDLDALIRQVAASIKETPSQIIGCVPRGRIEDIALFFAVWRLRKAIYPVSFRFPQQEITKRFHRGGAQPIDLTPTTSQYDVDELDLDAPATLVETSSGDKVACHTLSALFASAREVNKELNIQKHSRYALTLPLFHISGIAAMLRIFVAGGHLLLADEMEKATHMSVVSTQLYRFVQEKTSLPNLKCLLVGGGPLPDNLKTAPYPIRTSYGITEAGSTIAIDGRLLPHLDVRIKKGEIQIKGSSLMIGYIGQQTVSGWFGTGNAGTFERERLFVLGRLDRAFISGGEKIQPEIVERALLAIKGISQARVTAEDHPEFGQIPVALIAGDRSLWSQAIFSTLEKTLPRFMIPQRLEWGQLKESKLSKMVE